MFGYCLLNVAISRAATALSGVQLHQLTVPLVAEPPSFPAAPPPPPPLHPDRASATTEAPAAATMEARLNLENRIVSHFVGMATALMRSHACCDAGSLRWAAR